MSAMATDLADHAVSKVEGVLFMTYPLIDDKGERADFAIKVAAHLFGFATGAVQAHESCTYQEAVAKVAEHLVKAALAVPPEKRA